MKKAVLILLFGFIFLLPAFLYKNFIPKENSKNTIPTPVPVIRIKPLEIRSSIPYWDQSYAFESFKRNAGKFNNISLFWYYLTAGGEIGKYNSAVEDKGIIDFAHANNVKVTAVITNLPEVGTWDSERVEYILDDKKSGDYLINEISKLIGSLDLDGVTIDFEEVSKEERDNFTEFIKKLSVKLHSENKIVQVALHPKYEGSPLMSRYHFQDWRELAGAADHIYIMAYGEHYDEGGPGPIASVDWVEKIVNYAVGLKIPGEKLYLGIPLYGYDWQENSDKARGLTFVQVEDLLKSTGKASKWDDDSKSPFIEYEKGSAKHEVWYEDAKSVSEKMKLAQNAGFAGVTFWRLGGEDPEVWTLIEK